MLSVNPEDLLQSPLKLTEKNYTTLSQTPWAGSSINEKYKKHLTPKENIGESWELSFVPSKPSFNEKSKESLYNLAPFFKESLQLEKGENFDLLIKVLSTNENLSIQMHPSYNDKLLQDHECGKHESWLILEAKKESGIYLGFKENITIEQIKNCLENKENLEKLLNFIPVKKGDYFEIPPETVHAIGKGITLLEPQRILYGKTGKTLRFWDWNKKYDKDGKLDPEKGSLRDLHEKDCLSRINLQKQRTQDILLFKKKGRRLRSWNFGFLKTFEKNLYYEVKLLCLYCESSIKITFQKGYGHLFVLEGKGTLGSSSLSEALKTGDSYLITHKSGTFSIRTKKDLSISIIQPKESLISIEKS